MKIHVNADMGSRHIRKFCDIGEDSSDLFESVMERFGLSARAHVRILKIARTIADLDGRDNINSDHIAEAIYYKTLDRKMFR